MNWNITRLLINSIVLACFLTGYHISPAQKIGFYFEKDVEKITIPIKVYNNLIVLPVILNDKYALKFILDTGVRSTILVNKKFTDTLGITYQRKIQLFGALDIKPVDALVTNDISLSIAGVKSAGIPVLVLEENFLQMEHYLGTKIDGLIGYDIFSRFVVKVDYLHEKITLYEPATYKASKKYEAIPLKIIESKPIAQLNLQLNEKQSLNTNLLIDTGASHALILDLNSDDRITIPAQHIKASLGRGIAGEIHGYLGRVDGIQFGNKNLEGVITSFPKETFHEEMNTMGRAGSIGGELLKKFTVVFDFLNSRMYIKANKTFKYPFEYNMSGLEFTAEGENLNTYMIGKIRENSAAFSSEFKPGDILVSLNNIPSKRLNLTKIYTILNLKEEKKINLTVFRNGKYISRSFYLKREI